jgi:hypothetical protein
VRGRSGRLDVLRDLRNEVRLAVDHGGLEGNSHRDDLEGWYMPLNAYLSIGPPASRIEEMIALIEAGVLELTGPGTQIRLDTAEPTFLAGSTEVPGPPVLHGFGPLRTLPLPRPNGRGVSGHAFSCSTRTPQTGLTPPPCRTPPGQ